MRFGLVTPIVTRHPDHQAPWEEDAGPAEIARIAVAADRLGYDHVTCSEHVAIPEHVAPVRGTRYYDPLATFGFLAGQTTRLKFVTHVLVLPYHHPLAIAKRYGTLDVLSGGRLVLGVGVGTLEEEFALLGAAFAGRGARYEDGLRALRAAFARRAPAYAGTHYRFDGFVVDPCGVQVRIPIWLGGRSPRSLRRALELGDGWDPFRLTFEELGALLRRAHEWRVWRERTAPFDVVLAPDRLLDPTRAAEGRALIDLVASYRDLGATVMNLRFAHRSLPHYLEQLEAFARDVTPRFA
ncbi:MAG: TIGR03619 family F420-dependent LLM class oxidoreductase [Deltaproteobacteria bacterium]|nr:MAG: TIGR03619 family F420-dependent LLM class oxidoreductase [Deltaproteobacteria bacterium]